MTWFRIDDGFADHPKVIDLQQSKHWKGALALWTLAGSWSSKHLTDGRVPWPVVQRLGGTKQEADALVAAALWVVDDNGYAFHDWTDHNPDRETVEAKREAQRQRVANHRAKRSGNASGNALHEEHVTEQVTQSVTPPPTRPDPTRPLINLPSEGSPPAADARLPPADRARVFERWKAAWSKNGNAKLDRKRSRLIDAALKAYGLDAVLRCIDGYAGSAWHRGTDAKSDGTVYDDLALHLRDASHIERGIELAGKGSESRLAAEARAARERVNDEQRERDAKHQLAERLAEPPPSEARSIAALAPKAERGGPPTTLGGVPGIAPPTDLDARRRELQAQADALRAKGAAE